MAEYTYQTRKKITEEWACQVKARGKGLSETEKSILPNGSYYSISEKTCQWMRDRLCSGECRTLSELYKKHLSHLTDACVPKDKQEEFFYALDEMNQFQMTAGWYRRSLRSDSYEPFVRASILLMWGYSKLWFYQVELKDVLLGKLEPELYDHARMEHWSYAGMLAAQIDRGNRDTIQAVKDVILGEGNTMMISHELIRGITMCRDQEMYQLLGQFLLAARLQEGIRQAVCETMDAGRPEAFLYLFQVIEENNLVRYSAVKRAVSTWIGIFNEASVDRITEKLVRLMGQCLRDEEFCQEQLKTNDSVAISCALWAKGFYDAQKAIDAEMWLIQNGTKNQKMTASYFNHSLQDQRQRMQVSKEVVLNHHDDLELVACFLPGFLGDASYELRKMTEEKAQGYYSMRDNEAVKPKVKPVTDWFDSEEEARSTYSILKEILSKLPKKGLDLNPCIFPWHRVMMHPSDLAVRLCLIAWLLQDDTLLDEAAGWIPIIGQGNSSASRAAVARVLLYCPASKVRKRILFELLHNPEEYTMKSAFRLVEKLKLGPEDYQAIEKNLKYKTGRSETLALLRKQDKAALTDCIGRLLLEKSEESHMGALDLALQVKKEDEEEFARLKPMLSGLEHPTGKEQVILDELLGEKSQVQDIVNTPGYGIYDVEKEWVIPEVSVDEKEASKLFSYGEKACEQMLVALDNLVEKNKDREYKTAWDAEMLLGNQLENARRIYNDPDAKPLDALPFPELWESFYHEQIRTPQALLELYLYQRCRGRRGLYEKNASLYQKVFGSGLIKKPPFQELVMGLRYGAQAGKVIDTLFQQFVPDELKARWGRIGTAKLLSVLNEKNSFCELSEKRWNGEMEKYTERATEFPIFQELRLWMAGGTEEEWKTAFALKFRLQQHYDAIKSREKLRRYSYSRATCYLSLRDFVRCYVNGIWDKDLYYKAVFTYLNLSAVLGPASTVEQKGLVAYRNARVGDLNAFFGPQAIQPADGKYRFDNIGDENPAMKLAHEIYQEIVPKVLLVELKRGEQPTPFSSFIRSIQVIYGIDYMIQILTALGKDTLQRGYSYRFSGTERRVVLSYLLSVCRPREEETAQDLKKALKGTDITKKRLVELAMYAPQWIPLLEDYLKLPGLQSGCYYFMAHTSEGLDDLAKSMVAKYTPLSPEELRDGAFDVNWFFEAYGKLGEKDFKLLYDAAKYSSTGTAHGRARKYADAALGKVEADGLKAEIEAKRNKDLLMSVGLLPLGKKKKEREEAMLDRYQFIQKFKKESRNFGAQRRASEGRAVEIALRNLSVNAGFTDVTRLTLRMETKLVEAMDGYFDWQVLNSAEAKESEQVMIKISVDETGKSSLQLKKGGKALKSIPAKFKKDETLLAYQATNKKLKEQYSRTRQMMEQAMEDRTSFEAWELLELMKNPVIRPILEPLVMLSSGEKSASGSEEKQRLGFLTSEGLLDWAGELIKIKSDEKLFIAHPFDLYQEGHWHEYQKLLFEKKIKQPFKQVFRELYVKLEEELKKEHSMMFAGNQIQPQKTVGALRSRRWVADYEDGLQKVYYKENIVARIYAMADWFSPSDIEAPTLEWVVFTDRKTFKELTIEEIPDIIYSEVMRDVDLAVSVAHAGGVDPETSHSTVEMRRAIVECNLELFKIKNVRVEGNHAIIDGKLGQYTVHLGSGVAHQMGNAMLFIVPVHSQHRGRIFLPFIDDDPKTAEIMSKILLLAEDTKIKDPSILGQIR